MKDLPTSVKSSETMPDIQGSQDTRQVDIQRVGIKAIRHPIRVLDKNDGVQHTIATFAMYVGLPRHFRGTHMSRFVEILCAQEREISVENFETMLRSMVQHLDAKTGRIEMQFPFFMNKKAPVTGVMSLMDYDVTIIGELENNEFRQTLKIMVPVTSLCPCSKKISDRGAHNQRSHVIVTVVLSAFIWIEEIVTLVEAQGSCELFGLLKRPDEKYVTERAYDHPKFVEDIVRDVVLELRREKRISAFTVEAENFESIHNHSAYALVGEPFRG